ncbi:hypothetical protein GCM10010420_39790 [Streptomyces glaucosporus]|uniref:Uncharacterized protein n=1 Tax=Streptomyces glaucosporus TaxID=284044 RepID=A0ABP5VRP6_9ACTN
MALALVETDPGQRMGGNGQPAVGAHDPSSGRNAPCYDSAVATVKVATIRRNGYRYDGREGSIKDKRGS